MTIRLSHTTWDALNPHSIAEFWREFLDWQISEPESYHPGSDECYLVSPDGYTILFYKVPDAKKVKNRAHMDLVPNNATRDQEVDRAVELGATIADDRRDDLGWVVLQDPEGNEFCILNSS